MIHIIVVDDHQIVTDGLKTLLSQDDDIKVLDTFTNGQDAVMFCKDFHVDVALLDISMPIMDGITACEKITASCSTKIIALTNHQELVYIYKMLNAGALGYVHKTTNKKTLIEAIKRYISIRTFFVMMFGNSLSIWIHFMSQTPSKQRQVFLRERRKY